MQQSHLHLIYSLCYLRCVCVCLCTSVCVGLAMLLSAASSFSSSWKKRFSSVKKHFLCFHGAIIMSKSHRKKGVEKKKSMSPITDSSLSIAGWDVQVQTPTHASTDSRRQANAPQSFPHHLNLISDFFFSLRKQNSALDICDKSERICGTSKVQREFPDVIYSSCHNNRVDKIPPLFLQVYVRTERRSVKENLQWKVEACWVEHNADTIAGIEESNIFFSGPVKLRHSVWVWHKPSLGLNLSSRSSFEMSWFRFSQVVVVKSQRKRSRSFQFKGGNATSWVWVRTFWL